MKCFSNNLLPGLCVTSGKKSFGIFKKRFPFVALANCFSTRISSFIANHSSCKSIERNLIHCTRCYTSTFCNVFKIHDSALNQMNKFFNARNIFFAVSSNFELLKPHYSVANLCIIRHICRLEHPFQLVCLLRSGTNSHIAAYLQLVEWIGLNLNEHVKKKNWK